jgi:hypothetical protein
VRPPPPARPSPEQVRAICGAIIGASERGGAHPSPGELAVLSAFAMIVFGAPVDAATVEPIDPPTLAASITDRTMRTMTVRLMGTIEFAMVAPPPGLADAAREYAAALDVDEPMLAAASDRAQEHIAEMYADIQRHSWYNHETARRALEGRLGEIIGSRLAMLGGPEDEPLAAKWRALGECPAGSWGRAVFDFYGANGFAFPGEHGAIRVVGAEHDWVHVLTGYDTSPEGEIDVFSFIAASMRSEEGFAMLFTTLGIFQNGTIHHVAGEEITNATTGALGAPGAAERIADAFRRGRATSDDVLGDVDHFAWKDVPLDVARQRLHVLPRIEP